MKNVSIFGLQRSGNNLIKWIMDRNYLVCVKQYGRHYPFDPEEVVDRAQPLIITTKNLYAWLPSLYRWRKRCRKLAVREGECADGMSFSEFVQCKADPILRWNDTNRFFLEQNIGGLPRVHVRYEDCLKDIRTKMDAVACELGLPAKGGEYVLPKGAVSAANQDTGKLFSAAYYTEKEYLSEYTPKLLDYVYQRMDRKLAEGMGYDTRP